MRLRVTPSARVEHAALDGDIIHIWVSAPPVDGKANRRVRQVLAGWLGLPKSRVAIVAGESSRLKMVEIEGMDRVEVVRRLTGQR
jgi:uncharacterized protein (TIGR00251 family)